MDTDYTLANLQSPPGLPLATKPLVTAAPFLLRAEVVWLKDPPRRIFLMNAQLPILPPRLRHTALTTHFWLATALAMTQVSQPTRQACLNLSKIDVSTRWKHTAKPADAVPCIRFRCRVFVG